MKTEKSVPIINLKPSYQEVIRKHGIPNWSPRLLYISSNHRIDPYEKYIGKPKINLPQNSLPGWNHTPLHSKLPMYKTPKGNVLFSRKKLGEGLYQDIELTAFAPDNTPGLSYTPLHDRLLKHHYRTKTLKNYLYSKGQITKKNEVICSLKEFNDFRSFLYRARNMKIREVQNKLNKLHAQKQAFEFAYTFSENIKNQMRTREKYQAEKKFKDPQLQKENRLKEILLENERKAERFRMHKEAIKRLIAEKSHDRYIHSINVKNYTEMLHNNKNIVLRRKIKVKEENALNALKAHYQHQRSLQREKLTKSWAGKIEYLKAKKIYLNKIQEEANEEFAANVKKRIKQTNLLQLQIEQDTLRKKCDLRMEHYEHFHTPNLWIKIYHYLKRTDHKACKAARDEYLRNLDELYMDTKLAQCKRIRENELLLHTLEEQMSPSDTNLEPLIYALRDEHMNEEQMEDPDFATKEYANIILDPRLDLAAAFQSREESIVGFPIDYEPNYSAVTKEDVKKVVTNIQQIYFHLEPCSGRFRIISMIKESIDRIASGNRRKLPKDEGVLNYISQQVIVLYRLIDSDMGWIRNIFELFTEQLKERLCKQMCKKLKCRSSPKLTVTFDPDPPKVIGIAAYGIRIQFPNTDLSMANTEWPSISVLYDHVQETEIVFEHFNEIPEEFNTRELQHVYPDDIKVICRNMSNIRYEVEQKVLRNMNAYMYNLETKFLFAKKHPSHLKMLHWRYEGQSIDWTAMNETMIEHLLELMEDCHHLPKIIFKIASDISKHMIKGATKEGLLPECHLLLNEDSNHMYWETSPLLNYYNNTNMNPADELHSRKSR